MLACNAGTASVNQTVDTLTITVNRFDKTLLRWIEKEDSSALDSLYTVYPDMLDVLGKAVLNLRSLDAMGLDDSPFVSLIVMLLTVIGVVAVVYVVNNLLQCNVYIRRLLWNK